MPDPVTQKIWRHLSLGDVVRVGAIFTAPVQLLAWSDERNGGHGMYNQEVWLRSRSQMTTFFFRYAPPRFGVDRGDLTNDVSVKMPFPDAEAWQCSVYYYWWEFLRINPEYRREARLGAESSNPVARDFGDPVRYGSFEGWWRERGRYLFCEPRERGIRWAGNPSDLPRSDGCVYVSVPFRCDIEQALAQLRDILKPQMDAMKAEQGGSGAKYPVFTKPVLPALHKRLEVLQCRDQRMTLDEAGLKLGIGPQDDSAAARHMREVSVSRYYREARTLRDFAAQGHFPVTNAKAFEAAQRQRQAEMEAARGKPGQRE